MTPKEIEIITDLLINPLPLPELKEFLLEKASAKEDGFEVYERLFVNIK